ncbi:sulfonate transporter [Candidatus Roizmanbacteria bacterium RIFCSPHIGHO2_01_FULL_35_10]|uniref:Probable membrane transporter protein n=1 Tax=Candidatus Roizmanbacteria bacterium RIFCSPLOWO2_01_FULL_35_13 TaxID=1802055 RepID=A0A1F7I6K8_9BACT|nr:MAG: sulfonate transporter [Candidatus Roizmanbacteria bacterium RIFCSPHIGHO2_01_FULL_35_10]OGK39001.1 MAG: sulfonate transporter [Candidatus Roizmanbacteria bacterium RIFCSPLOWO2_01_FULL_35_13]
MTSLFFLSAFLAEVVGTVAGFGSSTIFLPLALLFIDFKNALVLVAFFHIMGNIGRIGFFRKGLNIELLIKFGVPSIFFTIVGALLVSLITQNILKGILGIFLISYSLYSLWRKNFRIESSTPVVIVGGSLSGFLAGLIGTGGALRGAFLTGFGLTKEKYIATAASIALAVDLTRIPVYLGQGFLENRYYWYLPILFVLALLGSFTGKKIVKVFPYKIFRRIVLVSLLLVGLKFLFEWFV